MHKLVIIIEPLKDWEAFEEIWPQFLHQVEEMPGLRREVSCRVERFLVGITPYERIHELFFYSVADVETAMASAHGRAAGTLLQKMTGGRMALFIADHKEDDIENIRKFKGSGFES
jgi:hypothetical protein